MASSEALQMNLAALQKVDCSISSIVDSANQVALYEYVSDLKKWDKTDIEGTLFVYMRSQKPQHGFMVMNRLNTMNLIEPVTEKLDFQDQTPFLLYRNGKGHIYGIWFYEKANCIKIYKLLTSLSKLAITKTDKSSSIRQRSYSESNRKQQKQENAQMDIISLLTRAQDEYDKKSAAKGSKNVQHSSNGDIVKPMPVRMNGAITTPNDTTPLTIGMLFAQAGGIEQKPNEDSEDFSSRVRSFTANSSNMLPNNSRMSTETILQNLLSNSAHTLQHIEGKHLTENSKGDVPSETRPLSAGEHMLCIESLEKDLKEKLNILPRANCDAKIDSAALVSEKSTEPAKSEPIDIPILTPAMLESFSSVPIASFGSFIDKSEKFCEPINSSLPTVKESRSFSPTQLLSPMDFTIPCRKKIIPSSLSPEPGSTFLNGNGSNHEDLLHPQSLLNGPSAGHLQLAGKTSVTPLNKDQFKEALVYMIQNDDEFVIQLHECYVKSLKSHLNSLGTS